MLQNPNQSNVDNTNSLSLEARRHCRNKKKKYLEDKIDNRKLKISETCIGASVTLRMVTSLQLI
jgi:hypothetical protein